MTDLSPAAQAVWHAYETANCDPYLIDPRQAGVAAALRAAADQCLHETPKGVHGHHARRYMLAGELRAIAAELEENNG